MSIFHRFLRKGQENENTNPYCSERENDDLDYDFREEENGESLKFLWFKFRSCDTAETRRQTFVEFTDQFLSSDHRNTGHPREVILYVSNHVTQHLTEKWTLVGLFDDCQPSNHSNTTLSREEFLRSLSVLSLLVCFKHNRKIIAKELELSFAQKLVAIVMQLSDKIDDTSKLLQMSIGVGEILFDDIRFLVRALLLISQTIVNSCPNVDDVSARVISFLPPQPWDIKTLSSFGFQLFERTGKAFPGDYTHITSFSKISFESPRPFQAVTMDPWVNLLLTSGVISTILLLLRKILRLYDTVNHSQAQQETLQILRKESFVLQNGTLFTLLALISLNPEESYHISADSGDILNTCIAQACCKCNGESILALYAYQTGILTLNLMTILNSYSTQKFRGGTIIRSEFLRTLFLWIMQTFGVEEKCEDHLSINPLTHYGPNPFVAAVQSCHIPIPDQFHSDLSPWLNSCEFVNASIPLDILPYNINYRLSHFHCANDQTSDPFEWTNILSDLSQFNESNSDKLWFFQGKLAAALYPVLEVLRATCFESVTFVEDVDAIRSHIISTTNIVLESIFGTLHSFQESFNSTFRLPLFEAHILLFLGRCLRKGSVQMIQAFCEGFDLWSCIFSSTLLLGGREEVRNFIRLNLESAQNTDQTQLPEIGSHLLNPQVFSRNNIKNRSSLSELCIEIVGFAWISVHDLSLDLASMIATIVNQSPTNKLNSIKRHFEIKPIIHALQESSENGDDLATYQILKWMSGYLTLLSKRGTTAWNSLSGQFFRAALAVCGYHLGDIRASAILQKEHPEDPILVAKKERPYMWISRRAAVELVIQVLGYSECNRWLRLFAHSKNEMSTGTQYHTGDIRTGLLKHTKSPAHVTLMLLFVDVRLRLALSYILSKVFLTLMTEKFDKGSEKPITTNEARYSPKGPDNNRIGNNPSFSDPEDRDGIYDSCIRNMLFDLFELVKWSSRQPDWYKGVEVAATILSGITQMIRSQRSVPSKMKLLQKWFRKDGLMLEYINSLQSCLQHSEHWNDETKSHIMHLGLICLTAFMSGETKNKLEFKALMTSNALNRTSPSLKSSQSPKTKKSSRISFKFDDLIDTIIRAQKVVTRSTFLVLFEMLFDGWTDSSTFLTFSSSEEDHLPQIANVSIIPVILRVMTHAVPETQIFILNSFIKILSGRSSLLNISQCSQMSPSVIDLVLDNFTALAEPVQVVAGRLLQILGQHSISVAQLKRIFQMMRPQGEFRPSYSSLLLRSLWGMIEDNEKPGHSFIFNGIASGIQIPPISRWPAQTAFTISLWVSVNSSNATTTSPRIHIEYRPFILSMRCANGNGFDVYLKQASSFRYRLCVRSFGTIPGGDIFVVPPKLSLNEGYWHYLAITMKSSGFRNNSELEIMVDDQFVRHKISFPKMNDIISEPLIGCCPEKYFESNMNCTLKGQMSALYLFGDALTEGQLRGIYGLGPSYFYSFEPYAFVHRNINPLMRRQTVDPILSVLDGSLTSLILLAYNPAVWRDEYYLDNTPEKNQVKWRTTHILSTSLIETDGLLQFDSSLINQYPGKMHARSLPGTFRCTTSNIRTALNSLGGVKVLFPLFAQFDQPRIRKVSQGLNHDVIEVLTDVDTELSTTLLDMLRCFLLKTSENEALFKEFQGFSIIGFFFERMSPKHLTIQSLSSILKFRDSVSWNLHFCDDILENLLLNFKIWKFASFEVQKRLFEEIHQILIDLDAKVIQARNITARIIDSMYLVYDYVTPLEIEHLCQCKDLQEPFSRSFDSTHNTGDIFYQDTGESIYFAEKWVHASSGHVDGIKLTPSELKLVRGSILKILQTTISKGNGNGAIVMDDIHHLIQYALLTTSCASKGEILDLLLTLFSQIPTGQGLLSQLLSTPSLSKDLLSLLPLASESSLHVKMCLLILYCMCLQQELLPLSPWSSCAGGDSFDIEHSSPENQKSINMSKTLPLFGIPILSIVGIVNFLQTEITASLTATDPIGDPVTFPAQVLTQILLRTLLGESCVPLIPDVMRFPLNDGYDLHLLDCADKDKQTSLSEPRIRIPAVLPALLGVLRHKDISVSQRLSTMVDLRTCILHSIENCDCILSLPAWQDCFLQLIFEVTVHLNQFTPSSSPWNDNLSRYLVKSKALVDTCVRTLCDVQFTAVRIGKPVTPRYIIFDRTDSVQLTLDKIFQETRSGERKLGVIALRETMSCLCSYRQNVLDELNVYKIGFDILQQTVAALQRESDVALSQKRVSNILEDCQMKFYLQNVLYLNIWSVGEIVLEFLTNPLGIDHNNITSVDTKDLNSSLSLFYKLHLRDNEHTPSLVELLFKLLGPLGPISNDHFIHCISEKYEKTIEQIGFLTGQNNLTMIGQGDDPQPTLLQAAEEVCKIMIRVLFSIFMNGNTLDSSIAILALSELKALLSFMCDKNFVGCGQELNFLISRLSHVLRDTTLSLRNEWIQGALNLFIDLILIQRDSLLSLLQVNLEHLNDNRRQSSLIIYAQLMEKYSDKRYEMVNFSVILMEAVALSLSIPGSITWEIWVTLITPAVDNYLHWNTKISADFKTLKILERHAFEEVFQQAKVDHASLRDTKIKSTYEHLRCLLINEKKIKLRWNQIVNQLANERGPWGYAENVNDVFWKLDPTETNLRMSQVLRRNEVGTSHEIATILSQKGRTDFNPNVNLEDSSSGPTKNSSWLRSGQMNSFISPHGLWRDLVKYRRQSSAFADNQIDNADRIDLEDDLEESKDTDVKKILFKSHVEVITKSTNSACGGTQGVIELSINRLAFTRTSEENHLSNKTGNNDFIWACDSFPTTVWHPDEIWNILFRKYQMRNVALEIFFTSRQVVFLNFFESSNQRMFYDLVRRFVKPPYLLPHYGYRSGSIIANSIHLPSSRTMTQAWVNRNISNFEYIMFLNTVAGRSFNDMSQYPVFPWIIADYLSPKLMLNDPRSFRDLRWPMGAQHDSQREIFKQRYQDLEDTYYATLEEKKHTLDPYADCLPPFHYGSHYSTMGFVLWYLIREEPFTSLNIWMQDGKFDKPDRIFDTIEGCWRGCTSNQADVKELIPEFFYHSDFLENTNRLNFGMTSSHKVLGAVGLPPWAKNSQDFIRQNRNALESEYVSSNLHHWIDLIFGYKQRPPHMGGSNASVESCNVYFHLTYEGAVDLDDLKIHDVRLYNQMIRQIDNYGQTPTELFNRPHPVRKPLDEADLFWPIASQILGIDTLLRGAKVPERPRRLICFKEHKVSMWPVIFIGEIESWEKLITIDTARIMGTHFWQIRPPDVVPPFQFRVDSFAFKGSQGNVTGGFDIAGLRYTPNSRDKRIGVPFAPEQLLRSDSISDYSTRKVKFFANNKLLYEKEEAARSNWKIRTAGQSPKPDSTSKFHPKNVESIVENSSSIISRVDEYISSHLFAMLSDYRLLFSCGHWDNSFKVTQIDSGRLLQSISHHRDVVTCLDIATDFGQIWLVTGSKDCTLIVWQINPLSEKPINNPPLHILYGHDDSVNCVSVNSELDLVVSGSDDGTIVIHKLREGIYIRSLIVPPPNTPPTSQESSPKLAFSIDAEAANDTFTTFRGPSCRSSRRIHYLVVSTEGYIIAYSNDDFSLYCFTINGKFQTRKMVGDRLHVICLSEDHKVLLTGGERGLIVMRLVHSLELSNVGSKFEFESVIDGRGHDENDQKPFASPIRSIYMTKQERHLIVGLENGEVRIIAQDSDYLRKRLHQKLMEIGILEKMEHKM